MRLTVSIALGCVLAAHARAGQAATAAAAPYELIRTDLTRTAVWLREVDAQRVTARDARGSTLRIAMSDVLAVLPAHVDDAVTVEQLGVARAGRDRAERGWLTTTDGQLIPGAPHGGGGGDVIAWQTSRWGSMRFSLERVKSLRFVDAAQTAALRNATDDAVLLTNGDLIRGFLSLADGEGVNVEGSDGKTATVPMARVAAATLANPQEPRAGSWVWLREGAALRVADLALASSAADVSFSLIASESAQSVTVPLESVVAFVPDHARVMGLAGLGEPTYSPAVGRRWTSPPIIGEGDASPLGAARIELPGPMSATWTLPAGATRFWAGVQLPESCRVWGDCVVVLLVDGTEVARQSLTAASPVGELSAEIPAGARSLTLTLDAGAMGSVEDRVVLSRAIVVARSR